MYINTYIHKNVNFSLIVSYIYSFVSYIYIVYQVLLTARVTSEFS